MMDIVERLRTKGPRPTSCSEPVIGTNLHGPWNSGFHSYNKIDAERLEAATEIESLRKALLKKD